MYISIFTDELKLDIEQAVAVAKEWGLKAVDLRGMMFQKPIEKLTDEELVKLKALLDGAGLKVGCIESSFGKIHLPSGEKLEEQAAKLDGVIRASKALGCNLVRSFFFWQPPNGQEGEEIGELAVRPDVLAQVMELFVPFAKKAHDAGLRLAFENCGCTKEECFTMLDALGYPEFGFAWDPKNSWMHDKAEREADLAKYLKKMAKRAICVHVKSTGLTWFEGNFDKVPYTEVFKALEDASYDGPVSIETHNFDKDIDGVEASKRVLEVIKTAWPTAAQGAQQESCSLDATTLVRPYADNPVRFGVVGLGMGHVRSREILQTSGLKLVQVCDLLEDRCKRTSDELHVPATKDYDELLANPELEAVMVMVETGHHIDLAMKALKAGKHVLVTKPMDMKVDRCEEAMAYAKEHGLVIAVDHCRRVRPSILSLKAAQENGYFGRPLSASVTLKVNRTMNYFHANGGWRGTRALDGGVLSNQTIHHLDELLFVFGKPKAVRCDTWTQTHEIEMEDLGLAVWYYANGMIVNIYATTSYPQSSWYYQMEIHGTEGAYIHREGGPMEKPQTVYLVGGKWTEQAPFPRESEWLNTMDAFGSHLRCGTPLLTTPEEGRNAVRLIEAMYESALEKGGAWVTL